MPSQSPTPIQPLFLYVYDIPIIVLDRPNPLGRHVYGPNISSEFIDDLYQKTIDNGAEGGKLLGAGGGGFLAIFAKPERHKSIKTALSNLVHVPFAFDTGGSTVCVYEPQGF